MDGDEQRCGGTNGAKREVTELRRAVDHHDVVIGLDLGNGNANAAEEQLAPQRTRYHPMARETVIRLLDIQRQMPQQLRGLAVLSQ